MNKRKTQLLTFRKTVAVAGTQEALSASHILCKSIVVQALETNVSSSVLVGDSNVDFVTNRGIEATSLNAVTFEDAYLDEVYVDVGTAADGVSVTYQKYLHVTRS